MPGPILCRVEGSLPKQTWVFTRHIPSRFVPLPNLAVKEKVLAKAAPSAGVWRPFKAEDSLLAFLKSL